MLLVSARQAWRDAYHVPGASVMAKAIEDAATATKKAKRRAARKVEVQFPAAYAGESEEKAGRFMVDAQIISAYETRSGKRVNSLNRCTHMLAAGKVMHAISTLPAPLQHLGHFMHSPMATVADQNRAHSFLYFSTDVPRMHRSRQEACYWLALAALYSWRGIINGQEDWWPARIAMFLADWGSIRIDASHWARDWAEVWELYLEKVSELEGLALAPVSTMIKQQIKAA